MADPAERQHHAAPDPRDTGTVRRSGRRLEMGALRPARVTMVAIEPTLR